LTGGNTSKFQQVPRNAIECLCDGRKEVSVRLESRTEQNSIKPKIRMGKNGYHDRSPSISLNSKSLRAFKHPKYTNNILIKLIKTLPAVRPSLNYSVMQFHFDPFFRISFAPSNAQGIQCRMNITAEMKKTTTYIARLSRSFLLPFGDVFSKDARVREQLLGQLIQKCWNLMGKVMKLIEKCSLFPRIRLIKGIEMMIEIILKNRKIPYGYNSYLNEVKKMRSLLSNRTNTNTLIESVKITSVYQSASPIAQDISFQPKRRSFRSIFSQINSEEDSEKGDRGDPSVYVVKVDYKVQKLLELNAESMEKHLVMYYTRK